MGEITTGGWFVVLDWGEGGGRQVVSAGKQRSSGAERRLVSEEKRDQYFLQKKNGQ